MLEKPLEKNQLHVEKFALFIVIVMSGVLIEQNNTNIHGISRKIRTFLPIYTLMVNLCVD